MAGGYYHRMERWRLDSLLVPGLKKLSPPDLIEVIVIDPKIVCDFVDKRPADFVAELFRRKTKFQMRAPEDIDHVGQLAGVIGTPLWQRQTQVQAEQPVTIRIQLLIGLVDDEYLDIVQTLVNPVRQAIERLPDYGFEIVAFHASVA